MPDDVTPLEIPARTIPAPRSVSPAARAALGAGLFEIEPYPDLADPEAWRALAARTDPVLAEMMRARFSEDGVAVDEIERGGVGVFVVTPPDRLPVADDCVYFHVHGGGLHLGAGAACRAMAVVAARRFGVTTWSVDYRMPPDHPYPTPLDDCLTAYRALLTEHDPARVVVGGESAGGNLAAALLLRARDEGLPLPAGAVLITPEVDLTESGDSFATNLGVDTVLTRSLMPANLLYANGHDLAHPYLSPLFGDFTRGFPPTLLQAGTRDLFLSNAVRMHRALRAAGVAAELHVFEAMPHGGFFGAPEDDELDAEVRRFLTAHWPPSTTP